jgi:hypothetical protein
MVTHALIDCILYVRHDSYGDPDFADTFTLFLKTNEFQIIGYIKSDERFKEVPYILNRTPAPRLLICYLSSVRAAFKK